MKIKTTRQGSGNPLLLQMLSDGELMRVELSLVDRDDNQPRQLENVHDGIENFAAEIKRDGLIHYPVYNIKDDGRFEIVVGERRTVAFRLNGEDTIPAICKRFTNSEKKSIREIQYAENDQKNNKPLSPIEDALWWQNYTETFWDGSLTRAAEARGVSKTIISQKLTILEASSEIKLFINRNINDVTSAYELVKLDIEDHNRANIWVNAYKAGTIKGSIRESIKKLNKETKVNKLPSATSEEDKVEPPSVPNDGVNTFPLNDKLLIKHVSRGDFSGKYLAYAFLSVIQKTPFQQSLYGISNLDHEDYDLFCQIVKINRNTSQHEKKLAKLEKKIIDLLGAG